MKICDMKWLITPNTNLNSNLSNTDFMKRKELMAEMIYYLFDSYLIPLIRGSFHVTESNVHRNQLFYFRHDVWQAMSEPALNSLKSTMLEECSATAVQKMLATRALGISQVRLLPKEHGMRPIINLRRRIPKLQYGHVVLGRSINSTLTPAFSVLNYEKNARPQMLGSALLSVDDIFPRLQAFRQSLLKQGLGSAPLFFAKVDVQSCFDTIPQKRLTALIKTLLSADKYNVARYSRAKLLGGHDKETPGFGAKPSWKYLTKATSEHRPFVFKREIETDTTAGRSRTVYVDGVVQKTEKRSAILGLLEEHIERNLIRVGNRFYRQKEGIPQGSIVSSLLCSFMYAELEREVLGFLGDGQSVLLRLIDDFLVVSTKRDVADRFMHVMHSGVPEFGVRVKAEKSRANFDVLIEGKSIARLPHASEFPYCGNAINTVTLDLSKDHERRRRSSLVDSVTVESSRLPGQTFYRKTLNALKLQMHAMLLATSYNSLQTVLSNLYHSFSEVAQKSYHYMRSLPAEKQPGDKLVIRAVDDMIKLACVLMKRRSKRPCKDGLAYECAVSSAHARCQLKSQEARAAGEMSSVLFAPARLPRSASSALTYGDRTSDDYGHNDGRITIDFEYDYDYWRSLLIVGRRRAGRRSIGRDKQTKQRVVCVSLPDVAGVSKSVGGVYRSLTAPSLGIAKNTMAEVEQHAAMDTAPSSPPELTYSKSDDSSYKSDSDDGGSTDKLSHFEDVTLQDDSGRESVEDCNVKPESRPTLARPPRKRPLTPSNEVKRHGMPPANARQENRFPSLKGAVGGVLLDQSLNLPNGRGLHRGHTSPSSPSFMMSGGQRVPSRSPSPNKMSSPQMLSATTPRSSWSAPTSSPSGSTSRRQSWQPGKKTAKQLEAEFDDGDDEVPDEAILENVPVTPLPGQPHPLSRLPSPQRRPSHAGLTAYSNLHSANVPKNAKRPSALTVMPNGHFGAPRSPRRSRPQMLPHSASVTSFQPEQLSLKHRSKSWAQDLNDEARHLSAALEEYAERLSTDKHHSGSSSVASSPPRPSFSKARTNTTMIELPQKQKGNIMIDPLPVSKEKEAVLSRTRPSWLPPKCQKEERKHVKEWEHMMARAVEADKKKLVRMQEQAESKEELDSDIARIWEEHVLPEWDVVIKEPRTRELWWRGVTPKSRALVWQKAVGNELELSHASFEAVLRRVGEVEERIAEMPGEERSKSKEAAWFDAIDRDVPNVYPETEVFEKGSPVHQALGEVLKAYATYRGDVGYVYGTHLVAGVLCLHMRAADAFVTLANMLNRPVPLAFLVHDPAAMARAYEMVLSTLKYKVTKLHSHLTSSAVNLKPAEFLDPIFRCLFAYNLPPEHVSRVWDIFMFEGDKTLVRAAVAVLSRLEPKLYGSGAEILELVGWRNEKPWDVGTAEEFITAVREAGKVDSKGEVRSV
ncbi:hypothetical protein LTR08_006754 [Meristemomyces frigidus]|nr:hypothetical protein LTR08_006754 [Meristemomyces frigidus]